MLRNILCFVVTWFKHTTGCAFKRCKVKVAIFVWYSLKINEPSILTWVFVLNLTNISFVSNWKKDFVIFRRIFRTFAIVQHEREKRGNYNDNWGWSYLALVAQWIRRRSPKPKIGGSSPPEGNHIFFRGPLMNCQSMNPQWITLGAILWLC